MGIGTMSRQAAKAPPAVELDFDTRLMLTGLGMDVLLSRAGGQALEDAHASVTAAVAAADRYSAEAASQASVAAAQRPATYRSQPILKAAGQLIRDRGWNQGSWTGEHGAVCALQAVRDAASGSRESEQDAVAVLLNRIRDDLGHDAYSVPGWNDSRGSVGDVLRLLY